MKRKPNESVLFLFIIMFLSNFSIAQNLLQSQTTSPYTYIYKISNAEAKKIYKNNESISYGSKLFHTLIDSFPTASKYNKELKQGHYIEVSDRIYYDWITFKTITNFKVVKIDNDNDFIVKVIDSLGNNLKNCIVKLDNKQLTYDFETETYYLKNKSSYGLLSVEHEGHVSFYNASFIVLYNSESILRKISDKRFVRVAINKFINLVHLPVDLYEWIFLDEKSYRIYDIQFNFNKFLCKFKNKKRHRYCYLYQGKRWYYSSQAGGYMVFNKPIYKIGDTVKIKAYLTEYSGNPIKKFGYISFSDSEKNYFREAISSYGNGGYTYSFVLSPKMKLKLDKTYSVKIDVENYSIINRFKIEDYELKKNDLLVRVNQKKQYYHEKAKLFLKAVDENNLNLLDSKVEVTVRPVAIYNSFTKFDFLRDTLMFKKMDLLPSGETVLEISDSIFPRANFSYIILLKLTDSNNEVVYKSEKIDYYYEEKNYDCNLQNDSIFVEYKINGITSPENFEVYGLDLWHNESYLTTVQGKYLGKLKTIYSAYVFKNQNDKYVFTTANYPHFINVDFDNTRDSVQILVNNPRKIDFAFYVYENNLLIKKGFSKELTFKRKSIKNNDLYLIINFMWGGTINSLKFHNTINPNRLKITYSQPNIVYPGKQTKIDVIVNNIYGEPVENVDLTAFSYTKKFDFTPVGILSNIPTEQNEYYKTNKSLTSIYENTKPEKQTIIKVNNTYNEKSIYPDKNRLTKILSTNDSATQFCVYVFSKNIRIKSHIIYVNDVPVYYSFANSNNPFSFLIDSGYNKIGIRTHNRYYSIDSLYFEPYKKTIISFDENNLPTKVKYTKSPSKFSNSEKKMISSSVLYISTPQNTLQYIKTNNQMFISPNYESLIGPLNLTSTINSINGVTERLCYNLMKNEKSYRYLNLDVFSYKLAIYDNSIINVEDEAITDQNFRKKWDNYINMSRINSRFPQNDKYTEFNNGMLLILKEKTDTLKPYSIITYNINDKNAKGIYLNNESEIHNLVPGFYNLIFIYPDENILQYDSIEIKPNLLSIVRLNSLNKKKSILGKKLEFFIKPLCENFEYRKRDLKRISDVINCNNFLNEPNSIIGNYHLFQTCEDITPGYIELYRNDTLISETKTDKNGMYYFKNIQNGIYKIIARSNDNNTCIVNNITVNESKTSYCMIETEKGYYARYDTINLEYNDYFPKTNFYYLYSFDKAEIQNKDGNYIKFFHSDSENKQFQIPNTINYADGTEGTMGSVRGQRTDGTVIYIDGVRVRGSSGVPRSSIDFEYNINDEFENNSTTNKNRTLKGITIPDGVLIVVNNNVFYGDINTINPEGIEKIEMVYDLEKLRIYGDAGKNGVALITLKKGVILPSFVNGKGAEFDQAFFDEAMSSSKIRSNFSDYAFWQPRLITDKDGKASFEVTFPDDVTAWETFYYAMNDKKQSGQSRGLIKSYKPLISQLAIPRFLITGDTAFGIGKVLNYTSDSIPISTSLEIDGNVVFNKQNVCVNAVLDSLPFVAGNDSLKVKYQFETNSGFFDGEIRDVPVFPIGVEETEGWFIPLYNDTVIDVFNTKPDGKIVLYARADMLDVIMDEATQNKKYRYLCNEQIASKIKSLLTIKLINDLKKEKYLYETDIKTLIKLLSERRSKDKLWGWWEGTKTTPWISLHVIEALIQAKNQGFSTLNLLDGIDNSLIQLFYDSYSFDEKARILKLLLLVHKDINIDNYLYVLENQENSLNFIQKLEWTELLQLAGKHPDITFLESNKMTSLFGNTFYSDNSVQNWLFDDIQITLKAYRIIRNDNPNNEQLKLMRYFLLEKRSNKGYWRNTYESSKIIETIFPDLIQSPDSNQITSLKITGDKNMVITKFPCTIKLNAKEKIKIEKKGMFPAYLTYYEKYWNSNPKEKKSDFEIKTYFSNNTDTLNGGNEIKLMVEVILKKDAEYLMINVPIPGGCSYGDKKKNIKYETHREYFRNETAIFCEYIPRGTYVFEINLIPKFSGIYHLNPAKVEMMYFPTFNANNSLRKINIK